MSTSGFDEIDEDELTEDDFNNPSLKLPIDESFPSFNDLGVDNNNSISYTPSESLKEFPQETPLEQKSKKPLKEETFEMPTDNSLKKAFETFEEISLVSLRIQASSNTIVEEIKELLLGAKEFLKREKRDNTIILNDYEKIHQRIIVTIKESEEFLIKNKSFPDEMALLKEQLENSLNNYMKELSIEKEKYSDLLTQTSLKIEDSVLKLTKNINLKPIIDKVNKDIGQAVHDSTINKVNQNLENFNDVCTQLEIFSNVLIGDKDRKGVLKEFESIVGSFDNKFSNLKKGINFFGYLGSFLFGILIATLCTYFTLYSSFEEEKNNNLIKQTENIHQFYKTKIYNLESGNKAYLDFTKRYSIDKDNSNFGFNYFEDNGRPYFYYPQTAKSFLKDGKVYIKLD